MMQWDPCLASDEHRREEEKEKKRKKEKRKGRKRRKGKGKRESAGVHSDMDFTATSSSLHATCYNVTPDLATC